MKKLIAAAVAAAVIAPASVMAAGPTLYGKIHMSVDMHDNNGSGTTGTEYDEWSLNSNSSRIGVKGSEDLGNGMKVGYLIEWGVDMDGDNGGSGLSMRNRAITLSGDWGTALAGKWDTPFKTAGRKTDLFGDMIGDTRSLSKTGTTENRAENVVAYVTPNMNGFSATVAYVMDAGTCTDLGDAQDLSDAIGGGLVNPGSVSNCSGDNSDANAWSFNAIYNNGPILVALGYVDYSDDSVSDAVEAAGVANGIPGGSSIIDNATAWRLGGAYTFGDFKVVASYTDMESQNFIKDMDADMWSVGGSYKMGNNTIKLQYSERDEWDLVDDSGADMWSIGIDHAMSKRTTVYAAYATTDNDDNSASTSWGGGHEGEGTAAMGEDADAFSVGIIHKF